MSNSEITLTVEDGARVRAITGDGAEQSGSLHLDRLHRRLADLFAAWMREERITRRTEMEVFGSLLYESLFGGAVGSLFERTLQETPPGERLRVQLSFTGEAEELSMLPWEFLYRPDTASEAGFFLATDVRLVLSRYLPLFRGRGETLVPADPPLRVLVAISQPPDMPPVLWETVVEEIEKLTGDLPLTVRRVIETTWDHLFEALQEFQPHVLHYVGHGRFTPGGGGELALVKPYGQGTDWYPGRVFCEMLTQAGALPRLVFLHACEGAAVDLSRSYAGLAPQLIREGVQAVVGMQYEVENADAVCFSRAFYRELGSGRPVDYATQIGRWRLAASSPGAYDRRAFGTPVLYMRSRSGLIQPAAGPATAPPP